MVQIRKPVQLSENIIDRRPRPGSARYAAKQRAEEQAKQLLAEALSQALKIQRRRPR